MEDLSPEWYKKGNKDGKIWNRALRHIPIFPPLRGWERRIAVSSGPSWKLQKWAQGWPELHNETLFQNKKGGAEKEGKGERGSKIASVFFGGAPAFTFTWDVICWFPLQTLQPLALTLQPSRLDSLTSWYGLTQDTTESSRPLTGSFRSPVQGQTFCTPHLPVGGHLSQFCKFLYVIYAAFYWFSLVSTKWYGYFPGLCPMYYFFEREILICIL